MKKVYVSETVVALGILVGVVMVLVQVMLGLLLQAREVDTHLLNSNCMEAFKARGITLPKGFNFTIPNIVTYPTHETAEETTVNDDT